MRLGLLAFGLIFAAACSGCGSDATPTATPEAMTATAPSDDPSRTPTVNVTTTPTPAATATSMATPPASGVRAITGLFTDPRPRPADIERTVGPKLPESFAPWNRTDVVLYDLDTMKERNFGPGGSPRFSPDGTKLAWASGTAPDSFTDLQVLELASGDQRSLGAARFAVWIDDDHLWVWLPANSNQREVVEVSSGLRTPMLTSPNDIPPLPAPVVAGYALEVLSWSGAPSWTYTYRVRKVDAERAPMDFEALGAWLLADGSVLLATPAEPPVKPGVIEDHTSNLFLLDPVSGATTFIATAVGSPGSLPVVGGERFIAWTDDYCKSTRAGPLGHTRVYGRQTRTLTQLDQAFWLNAIAADGSLVVGEFGPNAFIDLATLQYEVVLPAADKAWSPDHRYIAVGVTGGHGGHCPP